MTADQRLHVPNPAFSALFDGVSWQAIVARGVIGILFGILALMAPVTTALSLVIVFSIYLMADGFLAIAAAFRAARQKSPWGWLAFEGVANIVASVVLFFMPRLGMVTFVAILAVWSIIAGALKLAAVFRREPVAGRGWLAFSAIVSLLFGAALILAPMVGAVVLTWWLGAYGLVFGVTLLVLGFRVRSMRKRAAA
ncbi:MULTISPECIES: HdeD family acid-resistance protein [Phenylobacterium]|uniref:Uncharacterized membrane protein HdeD (DUF308 family) n=1 Tax=Phenylobacterium koreense TaxID=266125 RepID=A0ABV2EG06_9CAUL